MFKILIMLILCISGCMHHTTHQEAKEGFFCQGKISVQYDKKTTIVNFVWHKKHHGYIINLFGPMALGKVFLEKQDAYIKLNTQNEIIVAKSAEAMLQQLYGLHLPIDGLEYWILALPQPNFRYHKIFQNEKIILLEQNGWKIHYVKYINNNPQKILLDNASANVKVKLIISKLSKK